MLSKEHGVECGVSAVKAWQQRRRKAGARGDAASMCETRPSPVEDIDPAIAGADDVDAAASSATISCVDGLAPHHEFLRERRIAGASNWKLMSMLSGAHGVQ